MTTIEEVLGQDGTCYICGKPNKIAAIELTAWGIKTRGMCCYALSSQAQLSPSVPKGVCPVCNGQGMIQTPIPQKDELGNPLLDKVTRQPVIAYSRDVCYQCGGNGKG